MRVLRPAAAVCAVFVACGLSSHAGAGGGVTDLPPNITGDRTVSGAVRMSQDVTVAAGATLRFLPGTRVEIARKDAGSGGNFPASCEFHVHGRVAVDGTAAAPVVFDPVADPAAGLGFATDPKQAAWSGFFLYGDRSRTPDSAFVHARIRGASEGIRVADGEPLVERCAFDACRVGIAAGRIWSATSEVVEESRRPRPSVAECLFARCRIGIHVESSAAPGVARCSFLGNEIGIGNDRMAHYTFQVSGLGARADRCWFAGNKVAVEGPSVVENSIFQGNSTVFETTEFHSVYSQTTDWVAWRRNVFFDNLCVADGEADLGGENYVADPQIRNAPMQAPPFDALVVPLPGLDLARDSLVRGTATDGGDPGPAGRSPGGRRRRRWGAADRALRTVLVLGPPDEVDPQKLPKAAPAAAGERVGEAWWAAFDTDDQGGLDRSALRWPDRAEVVPAAFLWRAEGAGGLMDIELNVDGTVNAWRGGAAFPFPSVALRSGSRGLRVPAPAAGPGGLVVWWRSADFDPRIGVALHLTGGARAIDAAPGSPVDVTDAEPVRFGPKHVGLRVKSAFHWADLRATGVFRLRAADGAYHDLGAPGMTVFDAKGTLRADLPDGVAKPGATFVIDGLRDPWGRTLAGQPIEIDAEPAK